MVKETKIKQFRQWLVELKHQFYNTKQTLREREREFKNIVRDDKTKVLYIKSYEKNKTFNDVIKYGLGSINEIKVDGEITSSDDSDKIGKMTFEIVKSRDDVFKETGDILEKGTVNEIHKSKLE